MMFEKHLGTREPYMAKEKYISMKEAASLSGYTSDYVGQLIRGGKLPGKQVFSHVAWMTTQEALEEYMDNNKKGAPQTMPMSWTENIYASVDLPLVYKVILGLTITLAATFILFLVYILSVSFDKHIERSYQQKIEHI